MTKTGAASRAPGRPEFKKDRRPRRLETLEAFARRTGQKLPGTDRQRRSSDRPRVKLPAIKLPKDTYNISTIRRTLQLIDILVISAIILLTVWNAYIGINNRNIIAPMTAGASGALFFVMGLYLVNAYRFAPVESLWEHMKTVTLGSASALGLWLALALIARPITFMPDGLAIAGLLATAVLLGLHWIYYSYLRRKHAKKQLVPTVVMLGATEAARRLIEENARSRELNIVAIFDERLSRAPA